MRRAVVSATWRRGRLMTPATVEVDGENYQLKAQMTVNSNAGTFAHRNKQSTGAPDGRRYICSTNWMVSAGGCSMLIDISTGLPF